MSGIGPWPQKPQLRTIEATPTTSAPMPEDKDPPCNTQDIDSLMTVGLHAISRMMKSIMSKAKDDNFERETVQNLKDLMTMLSDLKKREAELLDKLTDEELEKLSRK